MNNSRLERQIGSIKKEMEDVIDTLVQEITELGILHDEDVEEIDRLKDRIDELEKQIDS